MDDLIIELLESKGLFLNSFGLVLDIIGALLIFFNSPAKTYAIILRSDEQTRLLERKARNNILFSKVGAAILAVGFFLQLLSNFIN